MPDVCLISGLSQYIGSTFNPPVHSVSFIFKIYPESNCLSSCAAIVVQSTITSLSCYHSPLPALPASATASLHSVLSPAARTYSQNVAQITSLLHGLPFSLGVKVTVLAVGHSTLYFPASYLSDFTSLRSYGDAIIFLHALAFFRALSQSNMLYIWFFCLKRHIWCFAKNYKTVTFPPGQHCSRVRIKASSSNLVLAPRAL